MPRRPARLQARIDHAGASLDSGAIRSERMKAVKVWELEAREQIRDLVARYNANGDSGRFDAMMVLFCENAVMEIQGQSYHGVDEIRSLFSAVAEETREGARARFIRHFTATHQIDILDERRARGRCYYQTLTDRGLDHWGRYLDDYLRVGDSWLFEKRCVSVDGRIEGGWSDQANTRLGER